MSEQLTGDETFVVNLEQLALLESLSLRADYLAEQLREIADEVGGVLEQSLTAHCRSTEEHDAAMEAFYKWHEPRTLVPNA